VVLHWLAWDKMQSSYYSTTKAESIKRAKTDFEQRKFGYNFVSLIPEGQKAPLKIK
jgi:hypothetical protein